MPKFQPVAIVGIGCRLPGAQGPEQFWRLLADGVDAITEVPPDRWDLDEYFDEDPSVPGKMTTRHGGFVPNVDRFDAGFFGISPREAGHIDPQQRILMEVAWEALEDAGLPVEKLAGQPVGVFVGMSSYDYGGRQLARIDEIQDGYVNIGSALSIAANRLSYLFDLRGPSVVIDTACSSSLVAAYYACQSLDRGESRVAIAAGVSLILSPAVTIGFSKLQAMAPDGRCKSFDARANGYVRSEGVGVVVLKPLEQALADGDRIYAVIRGGALNQDGRTNGLTAPNGLSQEALVRDALASAGVRPADIDYVEAHGTGTALGDPIELNALGAVLAAGRAKGSTCGVGSAKSNIGHLEAAAGVAGLIKLALSLERRQVPPSLHFEKPNPYIRFDKIPLRVVTKLEPWPAGSGVARGGVSAFGFGGTNAHLVLEEAPARVPQPAPLRGDDESLLVISAKSDEALRALAGAYADRMAELEGPALAAACATAALRRTHHDVRLAALAPRGADMAALLRAYLDGERPKHLEVGRRVGSRRRKVAFILPGHGSQWIGMGRELIAREPVFADAIARCAAAFAPHVDWSIVDELNAPPETSRLEDVDVVQLALFAIEVALAELWRSWGVKPDAVVGHSMGEAAAACIAGALSLTDAARIMCVRSRLTKRLSGRGAMAVVELPLQKAFEVVAGREDRLSVAANNSPKSTALAGDPETLDEVLGGLEREGVLCRRIKIAYASHSPQMDVLRDELLDQLTGITPKRAGVPLYSTVTGSVVTGTELGPDYWVRNLRQPVLFAGVIEKLLSDGIDVFVEISPHPILLPAIQQCLQHADRTGIVLGSLRRHESERGALLATLASLYTLGRGIDWSRLFTPPDVSVALPTYPWQRERYWMEETEAPVVARGRSRSRAEYPLLGWHVHAASARATTHLWQGDVSAAALPFLKDHRVEGHVVLPPSAYVEMALEAAREALGASASVNLENLAFENPLVLDEGDVRPLQVSLTRQIDQVFDWQVFSELSATAAGAETVFVRHARGQLRLASTASTAPAGTDPSLDAAAERCPAVRMAEEHYRLLADLGLDYGPAFQGVESVRCGEGEAVATLRSDFVEPGRFTIHPALLDSALQVLEAGASASAPTAFVPVAIEGFRLHRPDRVPAVHRACAAWLVQGSRVRGDVRLFDGDGALVAEVSNVVLAPLEGRAAQAPDLFYTAAWEKAPLAALDAPGTSEAQPATCLVVTASAAAGRRFAEAVASRGGEAMVIAPGALAEVQERHLSFDAVVHLGLVACAAGAAGSSGTCAADRQTALLIVQALAGGALSAPRLWLVTEGAQSVLPGEDVSPFQALHWDLARTVTQEHPEVRCSIVDLPRGDALASVDLVVAEILGPGAEPQVALRRGERFVARLTPLEQPAVTAQTPEENTRSHAGRPFRLRLPEAGRAGSPGFAATTRRRPPPGEVEIAVVSAGLDVPAGRECAGRIAAVGEGVTRWAVGDEVVALAAATASSFVRTPAALVAAKPQRLDFDDAAVAPIPFLTAHYALNHLGRLRRGERVLIHSATSAVGLACVRVAEAIGAEVYITADMAGQGVDVVVNSLPGEALLQGLSMLAPGGRFLELASGGRLEDRQIPLAALEDGRAFFVIDVHSLAARRPESCGDLLSEAMTFFEDRAIVPIPARVFEAKAIGEALQYLEQHPDAGTTVVRLDGADVDVAGPAGMADLMQDDGAYVVAGEMDVFALATGQWLVGHGARHLVLAAGRALSAEALEAAAAMERRGVCVTVDLVDLADPAAVTDACARWSADGQPVRGIVHAVGVPGSPLADADIAGAWNLHEAGLRQPLDFFVFSSAVASHFLDAVARQRHAHAQPAVCITWGPWSSLSSTEATAALERLLLSGLPAASVFQVDWTAWQAAHPQLAQQPFFSRVVQGGPQFADGTTIREQLLAAPASQRVELLVERLRQHTAAVLRLAPSKIDLEQPLITMGIDSLMAVELRGRVEKDLDVSISLLELVKGPSLSAVARMLVREMTGTVVPEPAVDPPRTAGSDKSLLLSILSMKDGERS